MKRILLPLLVGSMLTGCTSLFSFFKKDGEETTHQNENHENNHESENHEEEHQNTQKQGAYAAFLGRSENNDKDFDLYSNISIELDEFSEAKINSIKQKSNIFAYLNVGSLENYRDYYNTFKSATFMDYDNWPDERWIDVTNTNWQNYIINTLAKSFKEKGAYGVYMDNVDVYTIFKEEKMNYSSAAIALKNIIKGVNDLGLKVMINGGSEFLDDMFDKNDDIFNSIYAYHQEEVFSLILDYDKNIFGKQNDEDKAFYQGIAGKMKAKGKEIFFLEYTKDESLKQAIKTYCDSKKYNYYIAENIDLI